MSSVPTNSYLDVLAQATSLAAASTSTSPATTTGVVSRGPSHVILATAIGPLPSPKTITMTIVPDWNQNEIKSPLRPASFCVVLGPNGTLPQHAPWCFEMNMFAAERATAGSGPDDQKKESEEAISGKGSRALLWFAGKPYAKYAHAVVPAGCKLSAAAANDDLKTISIVLRTYSEEKNPNALAYVRKSPRTPQYVGYLKVVQGHHYYLNITFAAGSTIAQLVGLHGWRPQVYLSAKRVEAGTGAEVVTASRVFTNFVTNWAQGVELNPDDSEQQGASQALLSDQKDAEAMKTQSAGSNKTNAEVPLSLPIATHLNPSLHPTDPTHVSASQMTQRHPQPSASARTNTSETQTRAYATAAQPATGQISLYPNNVYNSAINTSTPISMPLPITTPLIFGAQNGGAVPAGVDTSRLLAQQHQQQQQQLLAQYQIQYQTQQKALAAFQTQQQQQLAVPYTVTSQPSMHQLQSGAVQVPMQTPGILQHPSQRVVSTVAGSGDAVQTYQYRMLQEQARALTQTVVTPSGQQRTLAFQHALEPLAGSIAANSFQPAPAAASAAASQVQPDTRDTPAAVPALQVVSNGSGSEQKVQLVEVKYEALQKAFQSKSIHQIQLPPLPPEATFKPVFQFDPSVTRFYSPNESILAGAIAAIEGAARSLSLDSKDESTDAAKHMLSLISAVNQLSGWQHVAAYIQNPNLYVERLKSAAAQRSTPATAGGGTLGGLGGPATRGQAVPGSMDDFQSRGQSILKRLCQRIDWLLGLQRKAGAPFDPDFAVRVIAADRDWAHDANVFMREAEGQVTALLVQNQPKFQAFRELQRKGVQWPHSQELRAQIENAGFEFRPMMIKRDRCVCPTCGVEVSGWRCWHNPWSFHNYQKHEPSFRPTQPISVNPTAQGSGGGVQFPSSATAGSGNTASAAAAASIAAITAATASNQNSTAAAQMQNEQALMLQQMQQMQARNLASAANNKPTSMERN